MKEYVDVKDINIEISSLKNIRGELLYLSFQSSSDVMKNACKYIDDVLDGLEMIKRNSKKDSNE